MFWLNCAKITGISLSDRWRNNKMAEWPNNKMTKWRIAISPFCGLKMHSFIHSFIYRMIQFYLCVKSTLSMWQPVNPSYRNLFGYSLYTIAQRYGICIAISVLCRRFNKNMLQFLLFIVAILFDYFSCIFYGKIITFQYVTIVQSLFPPIFARHKLY